MKGTAAGPRLEGTAIVLAGGESRRFGADKRLAPWNGGRLVEAAVENALALFSPVLVTAKRPGELSFLERPNVRGLADAYEAHALGGILTGLAAMEGRHAFVVAADMPLVRPSVARALWALRGEADAVVPRWKGALQPLCAVYARRCLPAGEALVKEGRFAVKALLDRVTVKVVEESVLRAADPEGLSFLDADTPAALEEMGRFSVGEKAA